MERVGVLLTRTCTTGPTDWVHGELWLCPDGLLRRSVGLLETMRHPAGFIIDPGNRPRRQFTDDEIARVSGANKRNRWIRREAIARAALSGPPASLSTVLTLELRNGSTEKLYWAPLDKAGDALEPWLGELLPFGLS